MVEWEVNEVDCVTYCHRDKHKLKCLESKHIEINKKVKFDELT